MPNIKSAKKRARQNVKREERNRAAKSTMKSAIKSTNEALEGEDKAAVSKQLSATQALIARTAKRGIIHKNKASRLQSRLMSKASKGSTQQ